MALSRKITGWILWRVALRGWFLQASWNFGRMQNLGFLFALFPGLRVLYQGADLQRVCRRHLDYFNTHPVLALPVLGASLHLEERISQGQPPEMEVAEFKSVLAGPCAAMGDSFFWGTLRPLAASIAVGLALAGFWWSVAVFLLLYNAPSCGLRIYGFWQGYRRGYRIVDKLHRWGLSDLAYRLRAILVMVLGGVSAWITFSGLESVRQPGHWGWLVVPVMVMVGWLVRRGLSSLAMLTGVVLLVWIGSHVCASVGF